MSEKQTRYFKYKESYVAYRKKNKEKCKSLEVAWYKKNKTRVIFMGDERRFGYLKGRALERDGYRCCICGMTDNEHFNKWKRGITVDHIDGFGRYSEEKHHSLDNFWTLCLSCHGRRDCLRYWMTEKNKQYDDQIIKTYRLEQFTI